MFVHLSCTRVTQQSPAWLPVLEKHDIPIVVGVGVSLAFIFITMGFYSLVQKNEPVPTSRAGQSPSFPPLDPIMVTLISQLVISQVAYILKPLTLGIPANDS